MKQWPLGEPPELHSAGLHDQLAVATHLLPCSQVASEREAGVFTDAKEFMKDKAMTKNTAGLQGFALQGDLGEKPPPSLLAHCLWEARVTQPVQTTKSPVFGEPCAWQRQVC